MRVNLKSAAAYLVVRSPVPELMFRRRAQRRLTCVAYHRILETVGPDYPFDDQVISATPDEFEREIRWLKRNLDVISLPELLAGWHTPRILPSRPAIITFDDGYWDNHAVAWPILKSEGVHGCFFLATGFVGTCRIPWWDQIACCFKFSRKTAIASPFGDADNPYTASPSSRKADTLRFIDKFKQTPWTAALKCLNRLREETGVDPAEYSEIPLFMDWNSVREIRDSDMEIGGHTRNHPVLSRVQDDDTLNEEICGCSEDLRRMAEIDPVAFAYPVGSDRAMSDAADSIIRKSFRISFSYRHSLAEMDSSQPFRLPRLHTEYGHDFKAFRLGMARAPADDSKARNGHDHA